MCKHSKPTQNSTNGFENSFFFATRQAFLALLILTCEYALKRTRLMIDGFRKKPKSNFHRQLSSESRNLQVKYDLKEHFGSKFVFCACQTYKLIYSVIRLQN